MKSAQFPASCGRICLQWQWFLRRSLEHIDQSKGETWATNLLIMAAMPLHDTWPSQVVIEGD